MKDNIKTSLEYLADLCLENSGVKTAYSDQDLVNATLIFMEVLGNKAYDHLQPTTSHEQRKLLWEEMGKNIRQTILLATGVDMHEAVKGKTTLLA